MTDVPQGPSAPTASSNDLPTESMGVLVMAYGSPSSIDEVLPYYTHIRRGRVPTEEQLNDLIRRYEAIGGVERLPLATQAQRNALTEALTNAVGHEIPVEIGQKHAFPYVEDGVRALAEAGVKHIVGVVMAPHFSRGSVGTYLDRAIEEAQEVGLTMSTVHRWWDLDPFVEFYGTHLRELVDSCTGPVHTLFTAHSLPERVLVDDPYADELHASAAAIAARAGISRWADWGVCWQSAGRTHEVWRGPDILDVISDLAETGRGQTVIVCAQGFTANHLEVAYDVDIEACQHANSLGLELKRVPTIEAHPPTMAAIAERILVSRVDPS